MRMFRSSQSFSVKPWAVVRMTTWAGSARAATADRGDQPLGDVTVLISDRAPAGWAAAQAQASVSGSAATGAT